jgi:hypothetical protein
LLDEGSFVALPSAGVTPRNEDARAGLGEWMKIPGPIKGFNEQVFFHNLKGDDRGETYAALINKRLGLGVSIHFNLHDLPHLILWKMPGEGEYVLGLEPANCLLDGRAGEREAGRLRVLEPGQRVTHQLEIKVLVGKEIEEIAG